MSICVIIEISEIDNWPGGVIYWPAKPRDQIRVSIPPVRRPTVVQPSREVAEAEAKRLAGLHPDRRFAIFECAALAHQTEIPTHTTLGGVVVYSRRMPVIVEVDGREDLVPF